MKTFEEWYEQFKQEGCWKYYDVTKLAWKAALRQVQSWMKGLDVDGGYDGNRAAREYEDELDSIISKELSDE